MSINDVSEIREVFAGFNLEEVQTTYSIAKHRTGKGKACELIITNV